MRFDDRLSTVLRQPVTGETIARIQYRQLLDLLGTGASAAHDPQIDAAYLRLSELSQRIPAIDRTTALREPGLRLRNPRLIAELTLSEPAIASAAIDAASLSEEQWLDLVPALPVRARGHVRQRDDLGARVEALLLRLGVMDRALPPADISPAQAPAAAVIPLPVPAPPDEPIEGIAAIVRRIEEFRRSRKQQEADNTNDAPRLPLDDGDEDAGSRSLESFDFATDPEGRIVWAEPSAAPMSIGLRLAASAPESPTSAGTSLYAAFRHRQPLRAERLKIDGAPAIAGEWRVDAAPRFDRPGGRFIGYCGRMRRPAADPAGGPIAVEPASDADRMRQILHELRTPVNAIQGFAEVIQQQLFGPTPHEYRAPAAAIASDGARILAGFEELDRLVKLDSGVQELDRGDCDIAAIITMTAAQLEPYMAARLSGFVLDRPEGPLAVAMARSDAERLVWRLLATLAGASAPGEVVKLRLRPPRDDMVRIIARLPASLAARDEAALFHAAAPAARQQALSAGMFGTGFALRLAAAEARAAGGQLERRDAKLRLSLRVSAQPPADSADELDAARIFRGKS